MSSSTENCLSAFSVSSANGQSWSQMTLLEALGSDISVIEEAVRLSVMQGAPSVRYFRPFKG